MNQKGFMKHSRLPALTLIAFATAFCFTTAHADDYQDVNQLVRAGKFAEALSKADQFLASKPKDAQMRFLKGVVQRDAGKTTDAIATFSRLTEDYPELPEPYNNLAVLYAGQSQFDKARTALEMAIRTNPSYATAHENLGDVYAKLASQAYNKALQLDAGNTAVAPKLALIRELFSTTGAKGQKPVTPMAAPTLAPPLASATPTKPAPTLAATAPALTKPVETKPGVAAIPAPTTPAVTATVAAGAASVAAPAKPTATTTANPVKEVESAVKSWAAAWSAKDVKAYLAMYGKEFDAPGQMSRSKWEEERRSRISSKSSIKVKLENLDVTVNGNKATAKFRQDYKAGDLSVSSRKVLDLTRNGDRWQIVRESTGG
jgi:tetratricopeptide (TPR) repeat protein